MRPSPAGTAATLATATIIGWTRADLAIIDDPARSDADRDAAAFRIDQNMDALDRRAAAGDAEAATFLDEGAR